MDLSKLLNESFVANFKRLLAKLSAFKIVFALSSSGYCAIHWLVTHNFSAYMFSGALVFGVMVAIAVASLSNFVRSRTGFGA
jgi:hypothetical protein